MNWTVTVSRRVHKQLATLPAHVKNMLGLLILDMEETGPVRGDWPNYGKLGSSRHHCHLKKGRPTYVAVWEANETGTKLIEVTYAGTHERAPY